MTGPAGSLVYSLLLKAPALGAPEMEAANKVCALWPLDHAGVNFALLGAHGGAGVDKASLISALDWPDKAAGYAADDQTEHSQGQACDDIVACAAARPWRLGRAGCDLDLYRFHARCGDTARRSLNQLD